MKTAMDLNQWLSVHRKLPYVAFPVKELLNAREFLDGVHWWKVRNDGVRENSDAAGSEPKELESPRQALGTGKNKSNNDYAAPETLYNLDSRRLVKTSHERNGGSHAEGVDSVQA